jgi:hypothetical protein
MLTILHQVRSTLRVDKVDVATRGIEPGASVSKFENLPLDYKISCKINATNYWPVGGEENYKATQLGLLVYGMYSHETSQTF